MIKSFISILCVCFVFSCSSSTKVDDAQSKNQTKSSTKNQNEISDNDNYVEAPIVEERLIAPVHFEPIKIDMNYRSLRLFDLDQMTDIMNEKLSDYRKNNRVMSLKEGLLIALARPNEDIILDKIINIVRYPLEDSDEWESTIQTIVYQCILTFKSEKFKAVDQITSAVVLENLISEFKPQFMMQAKKKGFETLIIEKIAQARLRFSKAAEQEQKLNQMRSSATPSDLASRLIKLRKKNN